MLNELDIPTIQPKRRISALEAMQGPHISALEKVFLMNEDDYEAFVLEWLDGYLKARYSRVRSFAGAGDKGRDLVGYYPDNSVDIYQCKHYKNVISPTTLYPELGKLCFYTSKNAFPKPKSYYIVAPHGCGPAVLDMIANPETINELLINNWIKYCQDEITKTQSIKLEGAFKEYVEKFDFSILKDIAPHELVEQHRQTQYHVLRFGGGIKKYRELIPKAEPEIDLREQRYTDMLFEVYQQKCGSRVASVDDLKSNPDLLKHFSRQRDGFYSAESLEKFSRDNFPDALIMPFSELKDDAEIVVSTTLDLNVDKPGYERVLLAAQEIQRQTFASNPLANELRPLDKEGICHHLANDNKIKWILNE